MYAEQTHRKYRVRGQSLLLGFCGLCFSNIVGLRWKDFYVDGEQARLQVVMQKTKAPIYLPLSPQALKWMPKQGDKKAEDYVFDLPTSVTIYMVLKLLAKKAGISKHITFHTAKYTFATMMKTLKADPNGKTGLVGLK